MAVEPQETLRQRVVLSTILTGVGLLLFGINHLGVVTTDSFYGVALIAGWFLVLAGIPGVCYEPLSLTRRLRSDLPQREGSQNGVHVVEAAIVLIAFGLAEITARFAYGTSLF